MMADKKTFIEYLSESKKDYSYVLKLAVMEVEDKHLDMLEVALKKYELKSASSFRKTPIQECPMDFPNVKNTPVHSCDIVLGYPASLDFLKIYICNSLNISPALVAVYTKDDPRQIEMDLYAERNSPEFKDKYKPALGSDYEETGDKDMYGEKYNTDFLKELDRVAKERKITTVINPLSQLPSTDHSDLTKGYDDFNSEKNIARDELGFFGRVKKSPLIRTGKL